MLLLNEICFRFFFFFGWGCHRHAQQHLCVKYNEGRGDGPPVYICWCTADNTLRCGHRCTGSEAPPSPRWPENIKQIRSHTQSLITSRHTKTYISILTHSHWLHLDTQRPTYPFSHTVTDYISIHKDLHIHSHTHTHHFAGLKTSNRSVHTHSHWLHLDTQRPTYPFSHSHWLHLDTQRPTYPFSHSHWLHLNTQRPTYPFSHTHHLAGLKHQTDPFSHTLTASRHTKTHKSILTHPDCI